MSERIAGRELDREIRDRLIPTNSIALPSYSTDMNAAFGLVEVMCAKDYCASGFTLLATREKVWVAGFAGQSAVASMPALAICIAALKALDAQSLGSDKGER